MGARRRWRRLVLVLGVLGALGGLGVALVSQTAAFRDWLRREVVARANRALAGRLVVGRVDGDLYGRVVLRDVRLVLDDARVLAVRRATATYDLFALLGGGLRIATLEVDGAALQLVADTRGWNVARLSRVPADEASGLDVAIARFVLRDGAVRVVTEERAWRLRDVEVEGAAHLGRHETRVAIARWSSTEVGSGLRLEAAGRARAVPGTEWSLEDVRLRTAGSQLDLAARVGRDVDVRARVARLAGADLRAVLGPAAPRNDWQGEIRARGPRGAVAVRGEIRLVEAGAGRDAGRAQLGGTLDLRAAPRGALAAELARVDLAALVGPEVPTTDLTGRVVITSRPNASDAWHVDADLRAPRIGATTVPALRATADVTGTTIRLDVDTTAPTGTATATATIDRAAERFDVTVTTHEIDLAPLADRPALAGRVNADLTLAGTGFAPATSTARAILTLRPSRIGAVAVAGGVVALRTESGRLVVERAHVATNAATIDATGDLAFVGDAPARAGGLRADVRATDLAPLAALLGVTAVGGAATATIEARGSVAAVDATVGVTARALGGADWRIGTLELALQGRRLGAPDGTASLAGRGHPVTLGARRLTDVTLDGWWRGRTAPARAGLRLRGREAQGTHRLAAEIERDAEATRVAITELRLDLHETTWTADGTPRLVQTGDRLTIEDLALRSDRGAASVRGTVGRQGPNDLTLVVDGLDLEALAGLVPANARGRLVGTAHLAGTAAAPRLDADVALASATLAGVGYDELRARLALTDTRAEAEGRVGQSADQALRFDGAVPVRFALAPWRFEVDPGFTGRVRSDGVDLAFLGALWPGLVTNVSGTLTADVSLAGTVRVPEARGRIAIAGGRAYVVPLGLTYDPVELALRLEGRAVSIERLAIRSGEGRLEGGGDARLGPDGAQMDARFEARAFPLFANEYGRGAAGGWLWISGTTAAPVLEGSLETEGFVLQIPEAPRGASRPPDPTIVVVGPGAPRAPVPARPKTEGATPPVPSLFERAAITVQLAVPRNAWVRRSDANVELQGWMTAWKKPGGELQLAGDIRGVRGWYAFQGKKFALEDGSVRFSGQGFDPVLDIAATHRAGEYLVRLRVAGTVTKPALKLESEPVLDQADVLAVLLFGAPASQLSRSQSTGLRERTLGIAGGYVAAELRQSVANALGVDDLQFDTGTQGLDGARLSVGKYVADDIFVSLAHRFGAQSVEEVRIEYMFRPEWSLETSTDTLGRSGVDLFWKRRY